MKELIKKLLGAGKKDALDSLEKLTEAAGELGYTSEQIEEALDSFHGFPLDDDDLGMVAGGVGDVQQADYSQGNTQMDAMYTGNTGIFDNNFANMSNFDFNLPGNNSIPAFDTNQSSNQGVNNGNFGISRL